MNIVLLTTVVLHTISIVFLGLCLIRIFGYTRRHRLAETHYTLLCGFIRLEHAVMAYIFMVAAFTVISTLFILALLRL